MLKFNKHIKLLIKVDPKHFEFITCHNNQDKSVSFSILKIHQKPIMNILHHHQVPKSQSLHIPLSLPLQKLTIFINIIIIIISSSCRLFQVWMFLTSTEVQFWVHCLNQLWDHSHLQYQLICESDLRLNLELPVPQRVCLHGT